MEMSPEAKRKVEQELKDSEGQAGQDSASKPGQGPSATGLKTSLAAFLCYIGNWISGIVFLVIEQKDGFVRFHAAQSVVVFGALNVLSIIAGAIPYIGPYLNIPVAVLFLVLWIWLAASAYQGRWYRIPVAAGLAETLARITIPEAYRQEATYKPVIQEAPAVSRKSASGGKQAEHRKQGFSPGTRTGRTIASCMAIFWSFVFMVFFNFYSHYIAYYHYTGSGWQRSWIREGVLTPGYFHWLPQMNIALTAAIIGHIITIIADNYVVYEAVHITINLLSALVIGSLLAMFPFDFAALSDRSMSAALPSAVRLFLLVIVAILVITAIVRIIRLAFSLARNDL